MEELLKMFDNFQFNLDKGYYTLATIFGILGGIVLLALFIVSAIKNKKVRVILIIAGVLQVIGVMLAVNYVKIWNNMELGTIINAGSEEQALSMLIDYFKTTMGESFKMSIVNFAIMLGWIFTLIAVIKVKASVAPKFKGLFILAILIQILNFVLMNPAQIYLMFFVNLLNAKDSVCKVIQILYDLVRYCCIFVPVLIVFLASILYKKPVEEIPAEAQPVQE